jgi:Fe(3+) dicitrate transport protein
LRSLATGAAQRAISDGAGEFRFSPVAGVDLELTAEMAGFALHRQRVRAGHDSLAITLQPATLVQEILVSATHLVGTPESLARLPGSAEVLTAAALAERRVFTTEEALRHVAGVHARAEEGFGLRPNIGFRGLSPIRSTRALLLEDGVPLSYAPYGDNASYYHPPIDRFESIEVVKGGGQIVYGPMTVGGVVNYITPPPPDARGGALTLTGGNRSYLNSHLRYGGSFGRGPARTGWVVDGLRKQGAGARQNLRHGLTDFTFKTLTSLGTAHTLGFKLNNYTEDSNVTYSGLREAEWTANPRGNPFRNDFFLVERFGASATHTFAPRSNLVIATNAYGSLFSRDWWRQSSNSAQRPNDATDPACGGMANLNTTCGNEGRLRDYFTWGVEPKVRAQHALFGVQGEADFGLRIHFEDQERRQENGPLPASRSGAPVENNRRQARAFSGFLQNRFLLGKWTFTPGLRVESVHYRRSNRLLNVRGATDITQVIPGLGIAYNPASEVTLFAGAHRGFAPPRVEDVISNSTGATVELDPELSWNYEMGARLRLRRDLRLEATAFRMDFQNQIIPASVAGGVGATLTNAGRTLHQGLEWSGRWDVQRWSLRGAWTWSPIARFAGVRFSNIAGFAQTRITGNRLPYAPRHLLSAGLGYTHSNGLHLLVETVYTGRQFGDDLNTVGGTPDGQRGLLPGNALWNVTLNYPVESLRSTFFVTTKNLFDRLVIVDRARGLLPGAPRLVQAGLRFSF